MPKPPPVSCEELGVETVDVGEELFAFEDPGSEFLIAFVPVTISGNPVCHEHTALIRGRQRNFKATSHGRTVHVKPISCG